MSHSRAAKRVKTEVPGNFKIERSEYDALKESIAAHGVHETRAALLEQLESVALGKTTFSPDRYERTRKQAILLFKDTLLTDVWYDEAVDAHEEGRPFRSPAAQGPILAGWLLRQIGIVRNDDVFLDVVGPAYDRVVNYRLGRPSGRDAGRSHGRRVHRDGRPSSSACSRAVYRPRAHSRQGLSEG